MANSRLSLNRDEMIRIPRWILGIPVDFWQRNVTTVREIVTRYKLKPVPRDHLPGEFLYGMQAHEMEAGTAKAGRPVLRLPPFPGGIRVPHLHYKAELYMLDDKQWRTFSNKVLKGLQAKLAEANTINFEGVMKLSDSIDTL